MIQMSIGVPGAAMAMPAAPRSAGEPLTKLQLNFSCKGLTNKDSLSKSDPALYVYMLNGTHETLLGITETVTNDLSPQWAYSLVVDYFFERQQMLRFYVVDVDGASKDRSAHDQLGTCDVPLAQIVSGKNGRLTIPLKGKGAGKGTLTVTSEELSGANELLTISVLAKNIDKKDFLGKSDGFLIFKRAAEGGSWIAVHKTEVVKNSLNPVWKPITISLTQLANGDWDRPLRIELYDWDANSDADFIGQFDTSANALRAAAGGAGFPLINAELAKEGQEVRQLGRVPRHSLQGREAAHVCRLPAQRHANQLHRFDRLHGVQRRSQVCAVAAPPEPVRAQSVPKGDQLGRHRADRLRQRQAVCRLRLWRLRAAEQQDVALLPAHVQSDAARGARHCRSLGRLRQRARVERARWPDQLCADDSPDDQHQQGAPRRVSRAAHSH
jgi:hypothetical protein